jgi:hypothetical protein
MGTDHDPAPMTRSDGCRWRGRRRHRQARVDQPDDRRCAAGPRRGNPFVLGDRGDGDVLCHALEQLGDDVFLW